MKLDIQIGTIAYLVRERKPTTTITKVKLRTIKDDYAVGYSEKEGRAIFIGKSEFNNLFLDRDKALAYANDVEKQWTLGED